MKKAILIDGNSLVYKAYYATAYTGNVMTNSKGVPTNAIYGFIIMLTNLIDNYQHSHMLVAFDAGKKTFRHDQFEEYKGTRKPTPNELIEQFPYVKQYLDILNITRSEMNLIEADDIIGTAAKMAENSDFDEIMVVSGDRDLLQLVSDKTTVCISKRGTTEMEFFTPNYLLEKINITPSQITDLKGMMGDPSDNIPGIPGVGEKTALKLLQEYQTLEGVIENVDKLKGKLKEKVSDNKDIAYKCKQLATIKCDVDVPFTLEDIAFQQCNQEELIAFFKQLDFHSFIKKYIKNTNKDRVEEQFTYQIIDDVKKVDAVLEAGSVIIAEIFEMNYHNANILGFGLVNSLGNFYIPFTCFEQSNIMKKWLSDETIEKITFDHKRSKVALMWKGYDFKGVSFDAMLGAYVLNPSFTSEEARKVFSNFDYDDIPYDEEVYGKGVKRAIPDESVYAEYVVKKALAVKRTKSVIIDELKDNNQLDLFEKMELPLASVLAEMEYNGIKVSADTLSDIGSDLSKKITAIEEKVFELTGKKFNLNSTKQLGVVLFEDLKLPPVKKTKTGYSTNIDVLEKLYNHHEIIPLIIEYRKLTKLFSTYVDGLSYTIFKEDNKIHTILNQATTLTGRLSSTEPNLQNIPIKYPEGRKIRKAFIPNKEDNFLFGADYSQVELRVLAHFADTPALKKAFMEDKDIHTQTAVDIFGVQFDEVDSVMRRQAKAVNFGIIYGISSFGLSENIGISRNEADKFIKKYLETYPGIKQFMDGIVDDAKENGYVETITNRRRYIPEFKSSNYMTRQFGERTAMNAPIQGSAADIIKQAMLDVDCFLKEHNLKTKLLLQVHDELIFDVPSNELELIKQEIPKIMENAYKLSVPLKVEYNFGKTWYDAK